MRKKRLFVRTTFENLTLFQKHTIHVDSEYYYVGLFEGKFRFTDRNTAAFRQVYKIFYDNAEPVRVKYLQYYEEDKIFKREVPIHEEHQAYRVAFEKRVVNQIIANIVGHAGDYY